MKRAHVLFAVCAGFGVLPTAASAANGTDVAYHFDRNAFAATARAGDGTFLP